MSQQSRGWTFLLTLAMLAANGPGVQADRDSPLQDGAVLEVHADQTATVLIDEREHGKERRFLFRELEPGKRYEHVVRVRFPGDQEHERTVFLMRGWHVLLPVVRTGQANPELAEQTGHAGSVGQPVFSPDGTLLLTHSRDRSVILWDTETGRQLHVFRRQNASVVARFSPTGKQILTQHPDCVILWDSATRRQLHVLPGEAQKPRETIFSPDGDQLLIGSDDGKAILWDTVTGRVLHAFGGPDHKVTAVAFHPDGKRIFLGDTEKENPKKGCFLLWDVSQGQQVRSWPSAGEGLVFLSRDGKRLLKGTTLWDTETGQRLRTFETKEKEEAPPKDPVTGETLKGSFEIVVGEGSTALSPDGKQVLTASTNGKAILWNAETGEAVHTFQAHTNLVEKQWNYGLEAIFSPDGTKVLTGSADGVAILWNVRTGRPVQSFQGSTAITFHPNGDHILTVSADNVVTLWDALSGEAVRVFRGHTQAVNALAVSPGGDQMFGGFADGTAVLWDGIQGQQRRVFQGHSNWMTAVAFAPDGRYALTGSDDKTAVLWERQTGRKVQTFKGHTGGVTAVAFSPDGQQVATGSSDQTAILWETHTGRKLQVFTGHTDNVTAVAFAPEGKELLTASSDKSAALWEVATGRQVRMLQGHAEGLTAATFSRDGQWILTGSDDKLALLWDRKTGQKVRALEGHTEGVTAVAFSPDGKQAVTGSSDKTALLWETETGRPLGAFKGHADTVSAVAVSPDGRHVLTGSFDQTAILWETATRQQQVVLAGHAEPVAAVAISPDGHQALTGSFDGTALLWEVPTGRKIRELHGQSQAVTAVTFSPNGRQVATSSGDGTAVLWDAASGRRLRLFVGNEQSVLGSAVVAVAISADGKLLLTASSQRTAIVWEVHSGQKRATFAYGSEDIRCAAFSPDGKHVLTGSSGRTADLWDVTSGAKVRTFQVPEYANALAFLPGGDELITGCANGTAILWKTAGEQVRTFEGHTGGVSSLAVSADGQLLLCGARQRGGLLWDLATGKLLRVFAGRVNAVAFLGGRHVLTGREDGSIGFGDVATGDEVGRLLSIDGGEDWAVVTAQGLFDGSREGRQKVYFREPESALVVPLDRYFQDFYSPGLLTSVWHGERPMPARALPTSPAPSIKILVNKGGAANQVHIDVALTDKGGGIAGPWLLHNGTALRNAQLVNKDAETSRYRFTVAVVPGENRLEVHAATADGSVESEPAAAVVRFDGRLPDPQLYVLAIGINCFAQDSGVENLRFCVADAQAIAELFRQRAGKLYQQVHVTRLLDEQATKANILRGITALASRAQPQDTLLLYVASHGYTVGQRFYLFPHDFRIGKEAAPAEIPPTATVVGLRGYRGGSEADDMIRAHGLAIDELGEALATVPALKRVLVFDTCQSGSVATLAKNAQSPFAFRGTMQRFSRAQGVYSLAAVKADELAREEAELNHSLLTYSLLAGLRAVDGGPLAGKQVRATAGGVDVLEWFRFVRGEVPGLYEKYVGRRQEVEFSGEDQPGFPLLTAPRE
jgi:WD40 repeat protein